MAWLRIDDRVRTHPKIVKAGVGGWLWVCGNCYCREHLTDGFIPKEALPMLAPGLPKPAAHVSRLLEVGLWHEREGGYQVHDFLDWNPSKAEVESSRESDRKRKGHSAESSRKTHGVQSESLMRDRAGVAGYGSSSLILEKDSRESKLWDVWRQALSQRGVNAHAIASPNEFQHLLAICALLADDPKLAQAVSAFVALTPEARAKLGVKSLTLGYFKMALPDLLEATPVRICRHRHTPPCADDVICTKRYLGEDKAGVA